MRDNVEMLANLLVAILAIGVSFAGVAMLVGSWFAIARISYEHVLYWYTLI